MYNFANKIRCKIVRIWEAIIEKIGNRERRRWAMRNRKNFLYSYRAAVKANDKESAKYFGELVLKLDMIIEKYE